MNTKLIMGIIASVLILGFAYYAISPLFITIKANDALPTQVHSANVPQTPQAPAGAPQVQKDTAASVVGTTGHPASGTARIVVADGKSYIRYENFKTINGPDIYVYLSKDLEAKEYISLGKVKATEGNINYEIPSNVNPKDYKYVLTWCKTFGVLFNSAQIF